MARVYSQHTGYSYAQHNTKECLTMAPAQTILQGVARAYGVPTSWLTTSDYQQVASVLLVGGKRQAVAYANNICRAYAHTRKQWVA